MAEITVKTYHQYLLDRIAELRNQLPNGEPFVFLGAFSLLSSISYAFYKDNYKPAKDFLVEKMGYKEKNVGVINTSLGTFFRYFSLVNDSGKYNKEPKSDVFYTIKEEEYVEKLNLSHKDQDHLKVVNNTLTLAANAFLDDLEAGINKAFENLTPLQEAQIYVHLNDGHQPVGYGG